MCSHLAVPVVPRCSLSDSSTPDPIQEFDNYAEWDLKDIDFVDDDSDVLHGELDKRQNEG